MDFSVTIEPLDGPLPIKGPGDWSSANAAKREPIIFAAGRDQIVFGRESTSDVVFDPGARMVGRTDCRLFRQPSGHYAIESFGNHYAEIDGFAADRGQNIPDGSKLRLGGPNGPVMTVLVRQAAALDDAMKTVGVAAVVPVSQRIHRVKLAVAAVAVALVVVAVGIGAWLWSLEGRIGDVAAMQEVLSKQAGEAFPKDVVDRIRNSAYAVVKDDGKGVRSLLGTAWPVAPGWLATNAHVALQFANLAGKQQMLVLKPETGDSFPVSDTRIHPGYDAFRDFRTNDAEGSPGFRAAFEGLPEPSAYDVALLKVDPTANLGAPLALASPGEVTPGMELAYAGYPFEGTSAQKVATERPDPSVKFGYVTSETDYFLFGSDPTHAYLVRHSVPATGGASGSAIVDRDGKVVALLSGGTVFGTENGRQPSAVLENFGQRSDLLAAIVDPPQTFDAAAQRKAWDAVLPLFDHHETQIVCEAVQSLARSAPGDAVSEASHVKASLDGATEVATALYRDHDVDVEAGHRYTFLVYGTPGHSLSLGLFRDGSPIRSGSSGGFFTRFDLAADKNETLQLRVFGRKDDPVDYDLYVFTTVPQSGASEASMPACTPVPDAAAASAPSG